MNNPITTMIESASLALKRRSIAAEKAKLDAEKKRIEDRQKEMQAMEEELRNLHYRRDSILRGLKNLATVKGIEAGRLATSKAKTDFHLSNRIRGDECPTARAFSSRAIEGRRLERELGYFLDTDVPAAEKSLADELAVVDKEIEAFEKRSID